MDSISDVVISDRILKNEFYKMTKSAYTLNSAHKKSPSRGDMETLVYKGYIESVKF